jgi:hypothetical protein
MACWSWKEKYLFVHVYKTGGTSLRAMLPDPHEIGPGHSPAFVAKRCLESSFQTELWPHLFKFAIVRNPYTWLFSLYKYLKRQPAHRIHFMATGTFYRFVDLLEVHFNNFPVDEFQFIQSQYYFTFDPETGFPMLDKIYKIEDYSSMIEDLRNRNVKLPDHVLKLNKNYYEKPIIDYFDQKALDIINRLYKIDFETFGYKMARNLEELENCLTKTQKK